MSGLVIPDAVLNEAGLEPREALTEFACRLFDAGKLTLWSAAKLARLNRGEMEDALLQRHIPIFRPREHELVEEVAALQDWGN